MRGRSSSIREGKWFWEEIGGKTNAGGEQKIVRGGGEEGQEEWKWCLRGSGRVMQGKKKYEDALGKLGAEVRAEYVRGE